MPASIAARRPGAAACPWTVRIWRLPGDRAEHRARDIVRRLLTRAGISAEGIADTELVVAELATNGLRHAAPPYELRVLFAGSRLRPIWCELADADPFLGRVPEMLREPAGNGDPDDLDTLIAGLSPGGRGLSLVHALTAGRCLAYPTSTCAGPGVGKAIGFAFPEA